jgi:GPH family glycoside/pentoside/hexuronide:cation symporter
MMSDHITERLPLSIRIGWASGSIVTSTLVFVMTTFFLRYMTDFVGIGAGTAATLLAVNKIFDAFVTPLMGMTSDRSRAKGSRRRRFLLIGASIGAVAMLAMFTVPQDISGTGAVVFAMATLLFSSLGYSIYNVSYLAMPAEMTTSPAQRANLISFRIYALAIAQFIAGGLAPMVLAAAGGGRPAYGVMAGVLAALIIIVATGCFTATRRARYTEMSHEMRARFWSALPTLFRSRLYVVLLLLKATFLIGSTAHTATAAYYVHHVMRASDATLSVFLVLYSVGMVFSQTIWLALTRRLGRIRCFIVAASVYTIASIGWANMSAEMPSSLFYALSMINGMGAGGILLVSESMLPEAIAEDYRLSGIRREATLVSLFSFAEKFALATGLILVGAVLSWYGYTRPAADAVVTGAQLEGVMTAFGLLPAVFVGASMVWLLLLRGDAARRAAAAQ